MKTYQQHLSALESVRLYIEQEKNEFGFRPDMLDELDRTAQEMLETIKELEKQTRKTEKLVYKRRKKDREGIPIIQEDIIAIGYLDVDGELVFNSPEVRFEFEQLFNPNDKFSREFYIKENKEFVSLRPKSLVLEVVHSSRLNFNEEFCVVGYVVNNQVIYYDQVVE